MSEEEKIDVKNTISYKIVDSMLSHMYSDQSMSDKEFQQIYFAFINYGGKWQGIIEGDPGQFVKLKNILKSFVKIRKNPKKYGLK